MSSDPTAPWDVYREIHKAMRLALFGLTTMAGNTRADDEDSVRHLTEEWRDVRFVLDGHHGHEDDFCDPLIVTHAPQLRDELEEAHRVTDQRLGELDQLVSTVARATPGERTRLLQQLHLDLAGFTAGYLDHLRYEEDEVMPALNAAMSNDELEAVTNQIRGSVPPPEMCTFIRYMVPAMNHGERVDMLGGMHAGAPPEIFEMFRAAAERALPAGDYQAVAEAAGFAG